jgi:two-component system response regulator FixJ
MKVFETRRVAIVDDDPGMRDALRYAVSAVGYSSVCYESADAFLHDYDPQAIGCVVLDVRMPGTNGLELQKKLRAAGGALPIIFLTGHGDISMCAEAMKAGAVDFIEKPFDQKRLIVAIENALDQGEAAARTRERQASFLANRRELTPREDEVMRLLVAGNNTKQVASQLSISTKTVDNHRASVLKKMDADGVVGLVRVALLSGCEGL